MIYGLKKIFFLGILFFMLTGFDFSSNTINISEIFDGGPPKDGIPALYDPKFISSSNANYLKPDDRILGIEIKGDARAYPISILNWHELVNDTVGGMDVLISYCPLCGTGMAFNATINNERFLFGVSGKLYNSDVLFYDRKTESLWSQIKMEAVTGPMSGRKLHLLPLTHTTWEAWKSKHSNTSFLSDKTGYKREYSRDPYSGYSSSETIYFPIKNKDLRLPAKSWILGVIINGKAKTYPFDVLKDQQSPVKDIVGGRIVKVHFDSKAKSATVKDNKGKIIPSVQGYWFAWAAFYPETKIFNRQ